MGTCYQKRYQSGNMLPKMVKIDNKIVKCYQRWQHVNKYRNKMVTNW